MTGNYRIVLMSAGAALALSGCTANGTGRIASIGTSAMAEASDGDANTGGGGIGGTGGGGGSSDVSPAVGTGTGADRAGTDDSDTDEGTKSGQVMNGGAMTAPDDGGDGNASGPDGGGGGGSGGTPATPRPRRAMLVTAGNAVLTGSNMVGGIDVGGAVTTVQGTITQLLDQAGAAIVDLGNGQSALVQQVGAIVGAVINVSTPAGSLLPSGGGPGAVGIALLAPDPAVGTVAAVSVLPTANSGQLASVVLSGAPIASAIAATAGAVPIVPTEALTGIANGLVAANVAGTSVGGGQALVTATVASPTPATASLATGTAAGTAIVTATVAPTLAAAVAAPVTQIVSAASTVTVPAVTAPTIATPAIAATVATASAVVAPAITAAVMPTITAAPTVAAPTVAIVPAVTIAPTVAVAPSVAVVPSVTIAPSVSVNPTVTAPVSVVVGPTGAAVAAPITAAITTGPLAGGGLIH